MAVLPRTRFLCTVCRKAETSGRTTQRDFFACMGLCRHYTARVAELADAPDLGSGGGSHGGSSPPSRTKQYREAGKLEKRSIPKIGACGVAKERHIMHVETTNVTKTSLPEGTGQMKKMLLIIALALLLVPSLAAAQYAGYGYYYPEYSTPQYLPTVRRTKGVSGPVLLQANAAKGLQELESLQQDGGSRSTGAKST